MAVVVVVLLVGASVVIAVALLGRRVSSGNSTIESRTEPRDRTPVPKAGSSPEKLEEIRSALSQLVIDLGAAIHQMAGRAAAYDSGLERHQQRLVRAGSGANPRVVSAEILGELEEMRAQNEAYKAELTALQETLREREVQISSMQLDMNTDHLTRIMNRRGLESRISEEMARAMRYETPFSVALFDIDRFKAVNDEYGHAAGDKVLQLVAYTLEEIKRANDTAGRYGGEEFMLLLPSSSLEQAVVVADRVRRQMERFVTQFNDVRIRVTLSGGVAQYDPAHDTLHTLMQRADRALYDAKENGRNRVECGT